MDTPKVDADDTRVRARTSMQIISYRVSARAWAWVGNLHHRLL